jgi:myo-inositol-1(or 4)-monophosphatase
MESMGYPQGAEGSAGAGSAVTEVDWLSACRRAVAAQRAIFEEVRGIDARTEYSGVGEGGDHALVIDRRCEDAVFAELDALAAAGASFVAISEERGEVEFGSGGETRVVIDPIDGSLNARRTIPSHSLSVAVAGGPTMADVEFGFVHDFGADEEFTVERGGGAMIDGEEVEVASHERGLEVVGVESAKPAWMPPLIAALGEQVYRLRVIGSIAITASYVAAGRLDGMLSLRPCRSVDAAAAQLLVREAGGFVAFGEGRLEDAGLGLEERYSIVAAADEVGLAKLSAAQRAGETR